MKKGRKLWEKTLAWVLAAVCCLSIVNLAPVAQKASAAADDIAWSELTGTYDRTGNSYDYIKQANVSGVNSDYKYLKVTYKGNVAALRLEFSTKSDGTNAKFFDQSNEQPLYAVSGQTVPLNPSDYTTVVFDLESTGVSGDISFAHMHYTAPGQFQISEAVFMKSVDTPVETFTFTLKEAMTGDTIDKDDAIFVVEVNGTEYPLTSVGSKTWTANIPTTATAVTVKRYNPEKSTVWNSWTKDGRGSNDTLTITGWNKSQWGTVEPETETQAPETEPSTIPSGDSDGTYWNYNFDSVTFNSDSVKNNSDKTLYLAPSVLYDYKEGRSGKSNGNNTYGNTSNDWNFQFTPFNNSLMDYYRSKGITTHMLIGGFDSLRIAGGHALSDFVGWDTLVYYDWALNHNLTKTVPNTDWNNDVWTIYGVEADSQNAAMEGIAGKTLTSNGDILVRDTGADNSNYSNVMPFFDRSYLTDGGKANIYGTIAFPFRYDESDGYYKFDSTNGTDNVYYNPDTNKLEYSYQSNGVMDYGEVYTGYWDNNNHYRWDPQYGFFPFNTSDSSHSGQQGYIGTQGNAGYNYATGVGEPYEKQYAQDHLNFGNGLRVDIPFSISSNGLDSQGRHTVFNFTGDDDLWVYVDGNLVLDMGGAHTKASGYIDFTDGKVHIDSIYNYVQNWPGGGEGSIVTSPYEYTISDGNLLERNTQHTLTVFYMERGLFRSNLQITFNFAPIDLSEHNYAEIGTPIIIDIPDEFQGDFSDTNDLRNKLKSDKTTNSSTIELVTVGGKKKIRYTSSTANTTAFAETFTYSTGTDANKKTLSIKVNNYKGNDDVYVVDYGLPIELHTKDDYDLFKNDEIDVNHVLSNDDIWELKLSADKNANSGSESKYTPNAAGVNFVDSIEGNNKYGIATVSNPSGNAYGSYKYTLNKFLDSEDTFYYGTQVVKNGTDRNASLDSSNATPIMTSKVTILPANVIYYEDNFSYTKTGEANKAIKYTGTVSIVDNTGIVTQSNNWDDLYGYDKAYIEQLTDSLGHAAGLSADASAANGAMAEFTFKGTGFDIISRTSGSTAGVVYTVFNGETLEKYGMIDTNYENGELYQLPVISVTGLNYGTHTVKVKAVKTVDSNSGIFYFDGIRIYNPANGDVDNYDHYKDSEKAAAFKSVRQMLLGNCTLSDTVIKNSSGTVVASVTDIPGCEATIEGPQITENHTGSASQSVDSLVASLASAPNNEVYLANNAKLKFKATPNGSVAASNRTLQIEAKLVRTGTTSAVGNDEKASATININGTDTVVNSSTAMYYNIPAGSLVDGKVNVEISIKSMPSNYALSITNLKYAGYTAFEPTAATGSLPGGYTYITAVAINDGQPVGYVTPDSSITDPAAIAADVKANDRVNMELTFSAPVTVTTTGTANTLKVYVNDNQGIYYFANLASQGGNTPVSTVDNKIALEVIAPKAAGNYTYKFVYTDASGNEASKVVNLKVTAKTARR